MGYGVVVAVAHQRTELRRALNTERAVIRALHPKDIKRASLHRKGGHHLPECSIGNGRMRLFGLKVEDKKPLELQPKRLQHFEWAFPSGQTLAYRYEEADEQLYLPTSIWKGGPLDNIFF